MQTVERHLAGLEVERTIAPIVEGERNTRVALAIGESGEHFGAWLRIGREAEALREYGPPPLRLVVVHDQFAGVPLPAHLPVFQVNAHCSG